MNVQTVSRSNSKEEEEGEEGEEDSNAALEALNAGLGFAELGMTGTGMGMGWERHVYGRPIRTRTQARAMSVPPRTTRKRTRSF